LSVKNIIDTDNVLTATIEYGVLFFIEHNGHRAHVERFNWKSEEIKLLFYTGGYYGKRTGL